MNQRTFIHFVCSPRPRVGKTLVARLLVDFFIVHNRPVLGFDTHTDEPDFAELFPALVKQADIRSVQGQVALFDGLLAADGAPKVVDVWHRIHDRIFELIEEIDFVAEARRRGIAPIVYFIDDPDPLAEGAHTRLCERFPDLSIVSVRNEAASGVSAVTGPRSVIPPAFRMEPRLQIPPLDPILRRAIAGPGFSLSAALRGGAPGDMSIVVRAAVRAWTSKVFSQLQDFQLRRSLSDAEYLK